MSFESSHCMLAAMGLVRAVSDSAFAPALLFVTACAVGIPLSAARVRIPWRWLSAAISCVVVGAALAYLFLPVLFEDPETNIACVSAVAMHGAPIYPEADAAARYSLAYGPLTYLAHIPFYWALGLSLVSFKLAGVLELLITLAAAYSICRSFAVPRDSLIGLGCLSLVFFRYLHVEFWGRNDPLLLCFTALALWAVVQRNDVTAVCVAGLSFAALPNLKISAVFYVFPIFVLFVVRRGWKLAAVSAAIALALFPMPFLAPQVRLTGYLEILRAVGKHGLSPIFLVRNLQYAALFLLPVGLLAGLTRKLSKQQIWYLGAIGVGLSGTCFTGAKIGAGSYHLLPLTLPILSLYFWIRSESDRATRDKPFLKLSSAWVMTMLLYSVNFVDAVWQAYRYADAGRTALADIEQSEARYRGSTLQVGIGDDFRDARTFYAYKPTFDGQPYLISGGSIRDLQFGGVPLPSATVDYIRTCGTRVWLIPRGQQPFTAQNTYYTEDHRAFGDDFTSAFSANYRKGDSGSMYDVWICAH